MRKLALTILFVLLSLPFIQAKTISDPPGIPFYQGSFLDLKVLARQYDKPFFVNFYTSWCGPCRNLNNFTFSSPQLVKFVRDNYLAYSVDAESLHGDGVALAQRFDVIFYPTILIFNKRGEVVQKLTGYQTAEQLLTALKKHNGDSPALTNANRRQSLHPSISTKVRTMSPSVARLENNLPKSSAALYALSVTKQQAKGYGLQVGVFGDYANVLKEVAALEESQEVEVLVSINELNGKTVFKVILGPFASRQAASAYMPRVGRKTMVIMLETL